jgi:hypothetical protein
VLNSCSRKCYSVVAEWTTRLKECSGCNGFAQAHKFCSLSPSSNKTFCHTERSRSASFVCHLTPVPSPQKRRGVPTPRKIFIKQVNIQLMPKGMAIYSLRSAWQGFWLDRVRFGLKELGYCNGFDSAQPDRVLGLTTLSQTRLTKHSLTQITFVLIRLIRVNSWIKPIRTHSCLPPGRR